MGIYGTIRALDDATVEVEIAPGVVVTVARGAIAAELADVRPTDDGEARLTRVRPPDAGLPDRLDRRSSSLALGGHDRASSNEPVLGLDLQGGISVVLAAGRRLQARRRSTSRVDIIRNRVERPRRRRARDQPRRATTSSSTSPA